MSRSTTTSHTTTMPNFLGIGVQRAATTWLHKCLDEHPQVFVPRKKELFFFSTGYDRGLAWYQEQFQEAADELAVGEITPTYLHEAPIARIAEFLPSAKLFVVLREPVQRAVSAYWLFRDTNYKNLSFREAFESSSYLRDRSLYAAKLRAVLDFYPRDRLKVFLYDDVQDDAGAVLRQLFEYLGVDPTFIPSSMGQVFNHVAPGALRTILKGRAAHWLAERIKTTAMGRVLRRRLAQKRDHLSSADERYCAELKRRFRDDVLELQQLTGRDLTSWL